MADNAVDTRRVALAILGLIGKGSPLDEAFASSRARKPLAALAKRDRALVRRLVTIALRHHGEIDHVIDRCTDRPLPRTADRRRDLLRLGVAQLLFAETPPHAAVDTTVRLESTARLRGFLNAVLRRVTREGAALLSDLDAARLNTPAWQWEAWCAAYGEDCARAIASAHLNEPLLDVSLKDRSPASQADWAKRLDAAPLPWGTLRCRSHGAINALPGYEDGSWWIQDGAAALPADLLGDVAGRKVFDLCAAPGGKTAQLAARGATVVAVDRSPTRLKRLDENLARLALDATVICADAAGWSPTEAGYGLADAVLLDAPCTATGTMRRRPDVALHKTPEDVARLTPVQDGLIDSAIAMVRPGGMIVYSSCSLQPEEGEQRIISALARHPNLHRVPVTPEDIAGQTEFVTPAGDLRTLPSHLPDAGGLDGFFAARMVVES